MMRRFGGSVGLANTGGYPDTEPRAGRRFLGKQSAVAWEVVFMAPPPHRGSGAPSQSDDTSLTLLQRAREQDGQAWQRLVALYAPLIYRVCRVAGVASHDAADVVQEVLTATSRSLGAFHSDQSGDSFRAWLLTISKNKIRDHFRRRAKSPPAVGGTDMQLLMQQVPQLTWESSSDGGQFDSNSNLMRRAIRLVRRDFAEKTWSAFWKTTIEGCDPQEVAHQLGISRSSVYQAKTRVLRRIREEMKGLLD